VVEEGLDALETRAIEAQAQRQDVYAEKVRAQVRAGLFGEAEAPVEVGRYRVLEKIGAGGLGVVYLAHDPELDRQVALKLLQPEPGGSSASGVGQDRLLREAQAMAQLSHPNVMTVFEVGRHGADEVFIAMEFVDGQTLGDWVRAKAPSRDDILRAFCDAGAGLAAAHAAGMIHRDFKPANVLVGRDGRVRVLDFGLAKSMRQVDPVTTNLSDSEARAIDVKLTSTGMFMGTPAYMSPEQHSGAPVDARSDQFAFCLALWESLFGARPYTGTTVDALAAEKRRGPPSAPDASGADAKVPAWIVEVLRRGLSPDQGDRFGSMPELLEHLDSPATDPRVPVRRRIRLAAASATVLLALGGAWFLGRGPQTECERVEQQLASAWDSASRQQLAQRFGRSGRPEAERTWSAVESQLDAYARDWVERRTANCAREDASEAFAERLCLDQRLRDFMGLRDLLLQGEDDFVDNARAAISTLAPPSSCQGGGRHLTGDSGAGGVQAIADVESMLTAASALLAAGRLDASMQAAVEARKAAGEISYTHGVVQARYVEGSAQADQGHVDEAVAALEAALLGAEGVADDRLAVQVLLANARVVGVVAGRSGEAMHFLPMAEAKLSRLGKPSDLQAQFQVVRGELLLSAGKLNESAAAFDEALVVLGEARRPLELANALTAYSRLEVQREKPKRAIELATQATKMADTEYGSKHPITAVYRSNLGVALQAAGRTAEAAQITASALEVTREAFGERHPNVVNLSSNLAAMRVGLGDIEGALEAHRAALKAARESYGEEHPSLAVLQHNLGDTLRRLGQLDEALEHETAAVRRVERYLGPDHPWLATMQLGVARVQVSLGACSEALRALDRATQSVGNALEADSPSQIPILLERARRGVACEEVDLASVRRAMALQGEGKVTWEGRWLLAQSLWPGLDETPAEAVRAEALTAAREALADAPESEDEVRTMIQAWIAARR
jgi:tetratricopeptide (TPR) repeat protein/predicted Ser/Thr protein kinase